MANLKYPNYLSIENFEIIITYFYMIYEKKSNLPVYIGVTMQPWLKWRFYQHCNEKKMYINEKTHDIKLIDKIEHKNLESMIDYKIEREKAMKKEQELIMKYKKINPNLLNKSKGGEWCGWILKKFFNSSYFHNKSLKNYKIKHILTKL